MRLDFRNTNFEIEREFTKVLGHFDQRKKSKIIIGIKSLELGHKTKRHQYLYLIKKSDTMTNYETRGAFKELISNKRQFE